MLCITFIWQRSTSTSLKLHTARCRLCERRREVQGKSGWVITSSHDTHCVLQGSTAIPPTPSEKPQRALPDDIAQRVASTALPATASWPRTVAHGPEIRPGLLQAFPGAGQGRGAGQALGPDGTPGLPTAAQRLAQLQRSIAARGGSMPSPTNSWQRSFSQVSPTFLNSLHLRHGCCHMRACSCWP